ncbi:MAG TPA: CocE/NonD family hydrolase C-terminal non-catalytic domain-containing protein, partial [Trebonia sp.]
YPAPDGGTEFVFEADEELELTGPAALRLWVSCTAPDLDVFVHIHQVGPDGQEYYGTGPQGAPLPLAMGWLRASHRELDPERSLPYRPYHRHDRARPLEQTGPVALDIEIWPTSIVLPAGHRLVVRIRAGDGDLGIVAHSERPGPAPGGPPATATLHTGGDQDSYLLLPVIPGD